MGCYIITFDVVDMHYPYNAIFDRDLLNTFEAAFYSAYLCLKVPASLGVISIFGSQKDLGKVKTTIEVECETKRVMLDPRVPNTLVLIAQDLLLEEEAELLSFLDKNIDVFTWTTSI
jgi:hypothetical protein